jgi:hypothetical protein
MPRSSDPARGWRELDLAGLALSSTTLLSKAPTRRRVPPHPAQGACMTLSTCWLRVCCGCLLCCGCLHGCCGCLHGVAPKSHPCLLQPFCSPHPFTVARTQSCQFSSLRGFSWLLLPVRGWALKHNSLHSLPSAQRTQAAQRTHPTVGLDTFSSGQGLHPWTLTPPSPPMPAAPLPQRPVSGVGPPPFRWTLPSPSPHLPLPPASSDSAGGLSPCSQPHPRPPRPASLPHLHPCKTDCVAGPLPWRSTPLSSHPTTIPLQPSLSSPLSLPPS